MLLRVAPHLIKPLQFVLPHEPHLRPKWMLRAGLFLYDRLGGWSGQKQTLPTSFSASLKKTPSSNWGAGLKAQFAEGFVYSDAQGGMLNVTDTRTGTQKIDKPRLKRVAAEKAGSADDRGDSGVTLCRRHQRRAIPGRR